MTVSLFYNNVTEEVVNYNGLKAIFSGLVWPISQAGFGVDQMIANTNPPNTLLATYPDLANWDRLDRDDQPTPDKIWKIAELDTATFNSGTGHWEQTWSIRERTTDEMIEVNLIIAALLEDMKQVKLFGTVTSGSLVSNATPEAQNTVDRLIGRLLNQGEGGSIDWQGDPDAHGLPQWATATVADLQALSIVQLVYEQKAYTTTRTVYEAQLSDSYDNYEDVQPAFDTVYDGL